MVRLGVVLIVLGAVLGVYGSREAFVSSGARSEPTAVELAKLEAGETPDNYYVRIGEHVPLYPAALFAYKTSKYSKEEPGPGPPITYCFYPIVSRSHPAVQAIEGFARKAGAAGNLPDLEMLPDVTDFRVLVKTKRFETAGSIPDNTNVAASVEGLIINRISSLGSDEKDLIRKQFPKVNLDKVLILEEGRKPTSLLAAVGMILGALVLVGGGIAACFAKRGKKPVVADNSAGPQSWPDQGPV